MSSIFTISNAKERTEYCLLYIYQARIRIMNATQLHYKFIHAEDRILSHHFIVDNSSEKILVSLALQKRILLFAFITAYHATIIRLGRNRPFWCHKHLLRTKLFILRVKVHRMPDGPHKRWTQHLCLLNHIFYVIYIYHLVLLSHVIESQNRYISKTKIAIDYHHLFLVVL